MTHVPNSAADQLEICARALLGGRQTPDEQNLIGLKLLALCPEVRRMCRALDDLVAEAQVEAEMAEHRAVAMQRLRTSATVVRPACWTRPVPDGAA